MKIAIIHSGNAGFFPRFYKALRNSITSNGDDACLFAPNSGRNNRNILPSQVLFGTRLNWWIHSRLFFLFGVQDVFSFIDTVSLVNKITKYNPDIIHLHLINDKFLNIPLFVHYVNKRGIPVVWTMHDCRAFTGGCPYFDEVGCERWKTGCGNCPQKETWIDRTNWQWTFRKKWHNKIENLTIVTPSKWLASFVGQSILKHKICNIIYNGVDIDIFSSTSKINVFDNFHIGFDKKIILGCAINWETRKGMTFFEQLVAILPINYQIVLVGGASEYDRKRLQSIGIVVTGKIKNVEEMVALYQNATVFVNPTMADNFPTTNIEALASGTPVVTFKTGGSAECLSDSCGIAVERGDLKSLADAIIEVVEHKEKYSPSSCIERSRIFSNSQYKIYVKLYHSILQKKNKRTSQISTLN